MQNTVFVCVMHSARHLGDELYRLSDRYRCLFNYLIKLAALDELHAEVALTIALAYFVDRNDAWMIEACSGFRFQAKTLKVCWCCPLTEADNFQCNSTVETLLPGTKNDSLSTPDNLFE